MESSLAHAIILIILYREARAEREDHFTTTSLSALSRGGYSRPFWSENLVINNKV